MPWYVFLERNDDPVGPKELLKLDALSKEEATSIILREYSSSFRNDSERTIDKITLLEIMQAFDMTQALKLEQLHLQSKAKANKAAQDKRMRFEQYLKLKEEFENI